MPEHGYLDPCDADPAQALSRMAAGDPFTAPVVVVAAHPDDEVIGMGARLPWFQAITFVHVTDGAPANMTDAMRLGFSKREEYAARREEEWTAAITTGGLCNYCRQALGFVDQSAAKRLPQLTSAIAELLSLTNASVVITHPYEGGHPDHDATAFAVHAAVALIGGSSAAPVRIVEFTSYHLRAGLFRTSEFMDHPDATVHRAELSAAEQKRKRRMLGCFATQREFLSRFPVETELFRLAPPYDFTHPPADEKLYYESFDWGMTRELWQQKSAEALRLFGLEGEM